MRDYALGFAALAALLLVAVTASAQTMATWNAGGATIIGGSEAYRPPKPVSDAEAVVGRPHDGIHALPARRIERTKP